MAFISLIFVFIIFIVLFLLLMKSIGIRLLSIATKEKEKGNENVKIITFFGKSFIFIPRCIVGIVVGYIAISIIMLMIKRSGYENVIDKWKNENVFDSSARNEIVEAVLIAADSNDKSAIKALFSDEIQSNADLDRQIEEFLQVYPGKLSKCEVDDTGGISTGSNDDGNYLSCSYELVKGDMCYYIHIDACYGNEQNPSEVGLHCFIIKPKDTLVYDSVNKKDDYIKAIGMDDKSLLE